MRVIIFIGFLLLNFCLLSQDTENIKFSSKDSLYNANIKKSKLYGVYIPRDTDDALSKLMELTEEDARKKLLKITEEEASKKLFLGLGKWMSYNWNFDEGSRFSHHLREKGLFYTEDMVRVMLILFHRKISNKPLDEDILIKKFIEARKKLIEEERKKNQVIISKEVIKKQEKN